MLITLAIFTIVAADSRWASLPPPSHSWLTLRQHPALSRQCFPCHMQLKKPLPPSSDPLASWTAEVHEVQSLAGLHDVDGGGQGRNSGLPTPQPSLSGPQLPHMEQANPHLLVA